jgi:hypothetical protein
MGVSTSGPYGTKNLGAPTITILAKPLSTAAQALENAILRPFALGVIAGTGSDEEFSRAHPSPIAMLIEDFGERTWA